MTHLLEDKSLIAVREHNAQQASPTMTSSPIYGFEVHDDVGIDDLLFM